jgi:tRNA(Arg) A34 adenosine deaminase TadA
MMACFWVGGVLVSHFFVGPEASSPSPQQVERDKLFLLAAQVMVYRDWQNSPKGRGHNIGAILVDKYSHPVFWARNAITALDDATQHGEVRLLQAFLHCNGIGKFADGYTVYTTLEPCAMCAGMMSLAKIRRVVYLQADPEYGNVHKALRAIDYPRIYKESTPHSLRQKVALERGYALYRRIHPKHSITDYLLTDGAREIFASAQADLKAYKVQYPENEAVLQKIREFLKDVTEETLGEAILKRCP